MGDAGDGPADVRGGQQFPVGVRRAHDATLTSFSASLDGSLKDVELPREPSTPATWSPSATPADPSRRCRRRHQSGHPALGTLTPMKLDTNQASIREAIDAGLLAGAVTLVWRSGEVLQVNELGYRDVDANLPMQRDTIFRIASMTKPVTVAAALSLLDEGKLALADPVAKWLPELSDMRVLDTPGGPLDKTHPATSTDHHRRPDDAPQRACLLLLGDRPIGEGVLAHLGAAESGQLADRGRSVTPSASTRRPAHIQQRHRRVGHPA